MRGRAHDRGGVRLVYNAPIPTRPVPQQDIDMREHKTLFLQAPSFDGFDGGAGSRYQAKREIRSFWYPTWLAQPAALVENRRLIDAPPHGTKLGEVLGQAKDFDLVVLHTSAPSFSSDVKTIERLKQANPD